MHTILTGLNYGKKSASDFIAKVLSVTYSLADRSKSIHCLSSFSIQFLFDIRSISFQFLFDICSIFVQIPFNWIEIEWKFEIEWKLNMIECWMSIYQIVLNKFWLWFLPRIHAHLPSLNNKRNRTQWRNFRGLIVLAISNCREYVFINIIFLFIYALHLNMLFDETRIEKICRVNSKFS